MAMDMDTAADALLSHSPEDAAELLSVLLPKEFAEDVIQHWSSFGDLNDALPIFSQMAPAHAAKLFSHVGPDLMLKALGEMPDAEFAVILDEMGGDSVYAFNTMMKELVAGLSQSHR